MTEEGLHACEISGCNANVSPGCRCLEHGGHPAIEVLTDEWGSATYLTPDPHADDPDEDAA